MLCKEKMYSFKFNIKMKTRKRMGKTKEEKSCEAPNPGGPLTTRQPAEDLWMSGNQTPHH